MANDERVARLIHSNIAEPDYDPIRRSHLFPPKKGAPCNDCGQMDGISLIRRNPYSDDEIREKSVALACVGNTVRKPMGALVGDAGSLRSRVRHSERDQQMAFIYDDPTDGEVMHAVLRLREDVDRAEQDNLRDQVRSCFDQTIAP